MECQPNNLRSEVHTSVEFHLVNHYRKSICVVFLFASSMVFKEQIQISLYSILSSVHTSGII